MAVQLIESDQIFSVNNEQYTFPNYPQGLNKGELIPASSEPLGFYWVLPNVIDGKVKGCLYKAASNSTKPRSDAAKVQRLQLPDNRIMEIYVTDIDGTASNTTIIPTTGGSTFAYYANGLGGATPVMTAVPVPIPIQQFAAAITSPASTKDKTFYFTFPQNANSLNFSIDGIWLNGLIPPGTQPVNTSTVAAYVTWANTNMSNYGTWAAVNATTLSLVSNNANTIYVTKAGIVVSLIPVNFCFNLTAYSTPQIIDGIQLGSSSVFPVPAFELTNDPNSLQPVLQQSGLFGNSVFTQTVAHKLGILTLVATPKLYSGVTLEVTAASGTC